MASQFFNELDNLSDLSQVIVLGATNREDLLDPALMRAGRLDYILKFPIPDEEERLEIFRVHTKERPLADDVNVAELAKCTAGMTGSHIAFMARRATMLAIGELINDSGKSKSKKLLVTASHFDEALKEVQEKEVIRHVESG
jgi:transitional endoplasmic reticulum ATPase